MADTIAGLRTTIRALAPKKALRRYPPELKDRIRATASRERACLRREPRQVSALRRRGAPRRARAVAPPRVARRRIASG